MYVKRSLLVLKQVTVVFYGIMEDSLNHAINLEAPEVSQAVLKCFVELNNMTDLQSNIPLGFLSGSFYPSVV